MTVRYSPAAEWAREDSPAHRRQELIAELAAIRAYEHRYDDFTSFRARGRVILAALSATTGERRAA